MAELKMQKLSDVKQAIQDCVYFLTAYLPLANCHAVNFITENVWETFLPENIRQELSMLTEEDLLELPSIALKLSENNRLKGEGKSLESQNEQCIIPVVSHDDNIPANSEVEQTEISTDFKVEVTSEFAGRNHYGERINKMILSAEDVCSDSGIKSKERRSLSPIPQTSELKWVHKDLAGFIRDSSKYRLNSELGSSVLTTVEDLRSDLGLDENRGTAIQYKFMSDKKSHEVSIVADVCTALIRSHQTKVVIDVGSGKGYLGTHLALQHGIQVLGVDSSQVNTESAKHRATKLGRQWNGLLKGAAKKRNRENSTRAKTYDKTISERISSKHNVRTSILKHSDCDVMAGEERNVTQLLEKISNKDPNYVQGPTFDTKHGHNATSETKDVHNPIFDTKHVHNFTTHTKNIHIPASKHVNNPTYDTKQDHNPTSDTRHVQNSTSDTKYVHYLISNTKNVNNPTSDIKIDHNPTSDIKVDHNPTSDIKVDDNPTSDIKVDHNPTSDIKVDHNPTSDIKVDHNPTSDIKDDHNPTSDIKDDHNPTSDIDIKVDHNPTSDIKDDLNPTSDTELVHSPISETNYEIDLTEMGSTNETNHLYCPSSKMESTGANTQCTLLQSFQNYESNTCQFDAKKEQAKLKTKKTDYLIPDQKLLCKNYVPLTRFVDPSTNLLALVKQDCPKDWLTEDHVNEPKSPFLLTGLHTCGDLATSVLRIFTSSTDISTLSTVGCCYNMLTEEFGLRPDTAYAACSLEYHHEKESAGFPVSSYLRQTKFTLGRSARNVACQSLYRLVTDRKLQGKTFYRRALLQKVLYDLGHTGNYKISLQKLHQKAQSHYDYMYRAFVKLQLPTDHLTPDLVDKYVMKYQDVELKMAAFFQLRILLAPCMEALILLDRLAYLLEQDCVAKANLVQLFDPTTSPRCYGLIAMKEWNGTSSDHAPSDHSITMIQ